MVDYIEALRKDLVEQFKGKPVIDAINEAIGEQLNELRDFFDALRDQRGVLTAVGKQLDGVGDIAVLSRVEAGVLACINGSVYVLNDDEYRTFLIYKIWKNTNHCTYYDIMRSFRMFWDKPLHYREDPEIPATMIFETDNLSPDDDPSKLLRAPFIKAGGVGILVIAKTENPEMTCEVGVNALMGHGYMSTVLPEIDVLGEFTDTILPVPASQNIMQTILPEIEEE